MRIFNYASLLLSLGLLAMISAGCSDAHGEKVATAGATSISDPLPTPTTAASQATLGDPESSPPATEEEQEKPAFEYPFPDRDDLFLPPAKKQTTSESRPESSEDVVLMGFADVGGARAVLRIDGIVTSLRVGESRGEVRVLAIDPPKVSLQRGKRQWTESLAEAP
ncbi:MAG: hypothetical protein HQ567_05550 [Candidatus Nealsonbacteria bacterium]|nr:hypothetical protein [Candidatus Nealsonbacteria bacterium]